MPFGGLVTAGIGAGISGLAGLFGGGKQQSTKGTSTTNASQTGTFNNQSSGTQQQQFNTGGTSTQSTTQQLSPFQQQLAQMFTSGYGNLFNQAKDVANPNGAYATGGLNQINQADSAAQTIANNSLASRGLSYSPAAATVSSNIQGQRLGQESQFLNSLPMLSQQLQGQALQGAVGGFSALPTASTTSGATTGTGTSSGSTTGTQSGTQNVQSTGTTNQTGSVSGNSLGGLFGGLGAGFFGGGGGNGGLGGILSNMFAPAPSGFGTIDNTMGR